MRKNTGALDSIEREWGLIEVNKKTDKDLESALSESVKKETNMKIDNIEAVSEKYYFARLSDNNVNNIQRDEFQLLNFFTASEANKLFLSNSTKKFLEQHSDLI